MTSMTSIPKTMRAMVLKGHGGLDQLVYHTNWPTPQPKPNEVLIRVEACGMNNTDINTRIGWYSKQVTGATTGDETNLHDSNGGWGGSSIKFPRIQGADVCGKVVAFGENISTENRARLNKTRILINTWVRDWDDPDNRHKAKYFGSETDGGFAEYTTIDYRQVHPIESDYSTSELATFATSWVTAENMIQKTTLGQDDWVLIPGASGGVGSALIQLAKLRGARVIGIANQSKHQTLRDIGADLLLERSDCHESISQILRDRISRPNVDVVADGVGGDAFKHLIEIIRPGGFYTCCGAIAGPIVEFDLRTFYLNDLIFTGATVALGNTFSNLVDYIRDKRVKPLLGGEYDLKDLHQAQRDFVEKKHTGNLVITL